MQQQAGHHLRMTSDLNTLLDVTTHAQMYWNIIELIEIIYSNIKILVTVTQSVTNVLQTNNT